MKKWAIGALLLSSSAWALAGGITVDNVWGRFSAPGMSMSGVFMDVSNQSKQADVLVGGSTAVAEKVELHNHINDNGVMRMREVPGGIALQAADIPLQLVDGRNVSLRALSHEQPLVLYFWGSWCGICRHTSPAIDKLARNGHAVLGVALQSGDDAQIDAYLHQHGWQFANLNDKQGDWSRQWQVAATPTIVLVKDGQMRFSTSGISSYWGLRARLWLVSLWPQ